MYPPPSNAKAVPTCKAMRPPMPCPGGTCTAAIQSFGRIRRLQLQPFTMSVLHGDCHMHGNDRCTHNSRCYLVVGTQSSQPIVGTYKKHSFWSFWRHGGKRDPSSFLRMSACCTIPDEYIRVVANQACNRTNCLTVPCLGLL